MLSELINYLETIMSYSKSVIIAEATVIVSVYLFMCVMTYIGIDLLMHPVIETGTIRDWLHVAAVSAYVFMCLLPFAIVIFGLEPLIAYLLGLPKKIRFYTWVNNEYNIEERVNKEVDSM